MSVIPRQRDAWNSDDILGDISRDEEQSENGDEFSTPKSHDCQNARDWENDTPAGDINEALAAETVESAEESAKTETTEHTQEVDTEKSATSTSPGTVTDAAEPATVVPPPVPTQQKKFHFAGGSNAK